MVASRIRAVPGPVRRSYEFIEGLSVQACPRRRVTLARLAVRAEPGNPHAHAVLGHESADLDEAIVSYVVAARLCETWVHAAPASVTPAIRLALAAHEFLRHDPLGALAYLSGPGAGSGGYLSVEFERLALASACAAGDAALLGRLLARCGARHPLVVPWLRACRAGLAGEPLGDLRAAAGREAGSVLDGASGPPANPALCLSGNEAQAVRVARACLAPGLARLTGSGPGRP